MMIKKELFITKTSNNTTETMTEDTIREDTRYKNKDTIREAQKSFYQKIEVVMWKNREKRQKLAFNY